MLLVTIIISLLLILCIFLSCLRPNAKIIYMNFSALTMIILYSFRSYALGLNDVEDIYMYRYLRLINIPFEDIFSQNDAIFGSVAWSFWNKIAQFILQDFRFFIFLNSLVVVVAVWLYIYKYSERYFLGTVMFVCIYFSYSIYLLRHFFAFAIIMIFLLFEKNKIIKYISMLIAVSIHSSSVVFFIFYFISKRINSKRIIVFLAGSVMSAVLLFGNTITDFLVQNLFTAYYMNMESGVYKTGNLSLFLFSFFLVLSTPLFFKKEFNDFDKLFIFSLPVLVGMIVFEDIYRLSFYLSAPYTILLYENTSCIPIRYKSIIESFFILISIVFFIYMGVNNNVLPYCLL